MIDRNFLLQQAERFRRLAREIVDDRAQDALLAMADEYEERANAVEAGRNYSAR